MRKKKVLIHGTADSLKQFFADKVSNDYEIAAILTDDNISGNFEVFAPQNLPQFVYGLTDGIIFTDATEAIIKYFLDKLEPRKIILWDAQEGWGNLTLPDSNGAQVVYLYGLEFHLRNEDDIKIFNETHRRFQRQRQIKNLTPQSYPEILSKEFQQQTGRRLDLKNPKTFTEKLQWLKLFNATPIKSRLADKYAVRSWIAEKIGDEYLIPLLGVWNNFDDINFDDLPEKFVLKCNHGSAMNIIVRDKKFFDIERTRERINAWLALDFSTLFLELHYSRIDRKIIAEKFFTNGDAPDLIDYKFWCFDGKPTYCKVITARTQNTRLDYFDMNWQHMKFEQNNRPNSEHPELIPKPKNFELMKKLASTLSEGFAFVRVDFYEIEGKVYFGEMTFAPHAGYFSYKSEGTDEYLGSLLKLPKPTPPPEL